jgi:uncharacterized protein YndB with AHSA1/START domain
MTDPTTRSAELAERELLHQIVIHAPIEAVWTELTRLDGRQRAMMDTILESTLRVGDPLYYKSPDGKRIFIVGRVLDIQPPRRLSHTQRLTTRDDPWTVVTWELAEVDGGTQVTLRHTGWPEDTPKLDSVDKTWAMILPELKRLLEDGDISTGLKLQYAAMRALMWTMPARTRAANVPEPPIHRETEG